MAAYLRLARRWQSIAGCWFGRPPIASAPTVGQTTPDRPVSATLRLAAERVKRLGHTGTLNAGPRAPSARAAPA
jgi:hypothetical protein